jgi:hypothetical protein
MAGNLVAESPKRVAVASTSCFMQGLAFQSRAAHPATCGVAMLVPLMVIAAVSLVLVAPRMFEPGATMSGFIAPFPAPGPRLLKLDMVLLLVVDPTV